MSNLISQLVPEAFRKITNQQLDDLNYMLA